MIAALYVDLMGPYPSIPNVECWDRKRCAQFYDGPFPIIAHPPCGPWSALRHLSNELTGYLAPIAVNQVRKFGGVLEHPAHSKLFDYCGLPPPMKFDSYGGFTIEINQCDFGHVARKRTWLYFSGLTWDSLEPFPEAKKPIAWCCGNYNNSQKRSLVPPGIRVATPIERRLTPKPLAKWLVNIVQKIR